MTRDELLKIIEKAAKKKAKTLDLSIQEIEELPPEIGQLTALIWLGLNGNQLTALPKEIGQLTALTWLGLNGNQLTALPKEIGQLTALTELDLDNNHLTTLPEEIGQLTALERLDLRNNQLTTLPEKIGQLTALERLDLGFNQLTSLSKEIGQLTALWELSLLDNQLTELPKEIGQLTALTKLQLWENKLIKLPKEIGQLTALTFLDLGVNQLTELPKEICQLSSLTVLSLFRNPLTEFPKEIVQLTALTTLNFSDNHLTEFPKEIGLLTELKKLHLDRNRLTTPAKEIGQLTGLTELFLNDNQLTKLPKEIGQLTSLNVLNLRNNQLTALPPEIVNLKNLDILGLEGNPLDIPEAIRNRSTQEILSWRRERNKESRDNWISKMILVGEGGTGKTSLLKRLRGEAFDKDEEMTHGLETHPWNLEHPNKPEVTMRLNCWDFGGQHILHATHKFFLTDRSLFVLVWNSRLGYEQGKLYYWLDLIHSTAPEAPVLIVATHIDECPENLPFEDIRKKYPQVVEHLSVSNSMKTGINEVYKTVQREAAKLPLMGLSWPGSWLDVSEAIQEWKKEKKYIDPIELRELVTEKGVQKEDANILETCLHDLGDILYFKDQKELNDTVVLDPAWAGHNICEVLISEEVEQGLGFFTKEHMESVWPKVHSQVRKLFLNLMEQFDLSYRTLDDREISIVVERLSMDPPKPPDDYESLWNARESAPEVRMRFSLDSSLPPGIPTWFIARSHRFTLKRHWRYGALFADDPDKKTHLGLIQAHNHDRYLELAVRGPTPANFFALLRDGLELTLKRYPGLKVESKFPCPCDSIKDEICLYEFDLGEMELRLSKKKETIECGKSLEEVNIRQLLYGLQPSAMELVQEDIQRIGKDVKIGIEKLDKVDEKQDAMHSQLLELIQLNQRGFLRLFQVEQEKLKAYFPRLFVLRPVDSNKWVKNLVGQKAVLQLYCEAPGFWHPNLDGGRYEIKEPAPFLAVMAPYIKHLVKGLKYAAPFFAPALGHALPDMDKTLKNDLKLMEALIKKLPEVEGILSGTIWRTLHFESPHQKSDLLGVLRGLLRDLDPGGKNYGLTKLLTEEGHIFWVCKAHQDQYNRDGRFSPLE